MFVEPRSKWLTGLWALLPICVLSQPTFGADQIKSPSDDPTAKAAYEVLEKYCSRCHQDGRLVGRPRPAGGFGNILKLDEISRNRSLIVAGNPYGSLLFKQIINQEMPYDVRYEGKNALTPGEEDIKILESWIRSLRTDVALCHQSTFTSNRDIVGLIAADLEKVSKERRHATRYLTLTHLRRACTNDDEMNVYRQAAVKLLNSLSQKADVVRLNVEPDQTILRINLDDLGWHPSDWDVILSLYPYNVQPDTNLSATLYDSTGTHLPYVRADWFAFVASQPPLYDFLLKYPNSLQMLAHEQGVDIEQNIRRMMTQRVGFQKSGVSRNNRLVERHQGKVGYFWTSYDFAGNRPKQSLFEFPLGPGGNNGFEHDGGETIFSLPNGFQAYFLSNARGERLDKAPTAIVRDSFRKDFAVTNGISCMGCHDQGIQKAKDEIRNFVLEGRAFPKFVRDAVELLHPPAEKIDQVLADDVKRFNNAMERAGLDPTLKLNGVEMINALAKRYEEDVDLVVAAAELGLNKEKFLEAAKDADKTLKPLIRRLEQGLVPREQFEQIFRDLSHDLTDEQVVTVADNHRGLPSRRIETTSDLFLTSDRDIYQRDETPVFSIVSSRDCYLTLTSVDDKGNGTVLIPNRFNQDNRIRANVETHFPDTKAPYQYRLKDEGFETVVASCDEMNVAIDGIVHDFGHSPFTQVKNYSGAVARSMLEAKNSMVVEPTGVRPPVKPAISRTAIKIEVR